MNGNDLEKKLIKGRNESGLFFSKTDMRSLRNRTHARTEQRSSKKTRPLLPFAVKAALVAASLLIVAGVFSALAFGTSGINGGSRSEALSQQEVYLGKEKGALLSYFSVKAPNDTKPSLMSVLWDQGSSDTETLYSTVFKECNVTYPASSITFPDNGRSLVLIFTGSSQEGFIDYRLIGYDNDSITEWWSQDFVPSGKLSVKDGVVMEERKEPFDSYQYDFAVTYIIPYVIQTPGSIVLPVQDLQLRLGQQILFVGGSSDPLTASSQNGLIEKVQREDNQARQTVLGYKATGKGSDVLLLSGENITGSSLNLNITD